MRIAAGFFVRAASSMAAIETRGWTKKRARKAAGTPSRRVAAKTLIKPPAKAAGWPVSRTLLMAGRVTCQKAAQAPGPKASREATPRAMAAKAAKAKARRDRSK